jgi:hypothetical protein
MNHLDGENLLHEHTGWILSAAIGSGFDWKQVPLLCMHDGKIMRLVEDTGNLMPTDEIMTSDEAFALFGDISVNRRFDRRIEVPVQVLAFPDGQHFVSDAGTTYATRGHVLEVIDVSPAPGPYAELAPSAGQEVSYVFAKGLCPGPSPVPVAAALPKP